MKLFVISEKDHSDTSESGVMNVGTNCLVMNSGRTMIAISSGVISRITIRALPDLLVLRTFESNMGTIFGLAWVTETTFLACSKTGITLWDAETGRTHNSYSANDILHSTKYRAMKTFDNGSKVIVSGSGIRICDVDKLNSLNFRDKLAPRSLCIEHLTELGNIFATGGNEKMHLVDPRMLKPVTNITGIRVRTISYMKHNIIAVAGESHTVELYDVRQITHPVETRWVNRELDVFPVKDLETSQRDQNDYMSYDCVFSLAYNRRTGNLFVGGGDERSGIMSGYLGIFK